jgi:hypothetical protein
MVESQESKLIHCSLSFAPIFMQDSANKAASKAFEQYAGAKLEYS